MVDNGTNDVNETAAGNNDNSDNDAAVTAEAVAMVEDMIAEAGAIDEVAETTALVAQQIHLPDTLEGCYAYIKRQFLGIELVNSLSYWNTGRAVLDMEERFELKDVVSSVARETGIKDRAVRYCRAVARTFEYGTVKLLCARGMEWSTLRELTSEHLDACREDLIRRFLAHELTDLEVRNLAIETRAEGRRADIPGTATEAESADNSPAGRHEEIAQQFTGEKAKAMDVAKHFHETIQKFGDRCKGDLADAVIRSDGQDDAEVVSELQELEQQVQNAVVAAIDAIISMHIMSASTAYPFNTIEASIEHGRQYLAQGRADAPAPAPARDIVFEDEDEDDKEEEAEETTDDNKA